MVNTNRAGVVSKDIVTVSHTPAARLADRLREFSFHYRISESAVLERALQIFLESGNEEQLAVDLRTSGYGLRRRAS